MSVRNWLPYTSAGIGIGVAISLIAAFALQNYERTSECEYYSAEPHCQDAASNSPSVRVTPSQSEHGPNPDPYAERKDWRDEQDLKAQRKMANWAFWAVMAALGSVAVTGMGVILVAFTLEETRKAVVESAKASKAGMIAARAAQASVKVTSDTAERQLRAYVGVKSAVAFYVDSGYGIEASADIKNSGQTPADSLVVWANVKVADIDKPPFTDAPVGDDPTKYCKTIVGPGIESEIARGCSITDQEREAISANKKAIFFWAFIRYDDAFNKPRHLNFRWWASGPDRVMIASNGRKRNGWAFQPHPRGDEGN